MAVTSEKNPELITWLEHLVKDIYENADSVDGLAVAMISENSIRTAYYNMTGGDKILAGGYITQDATMDAVKDLLTDIFTEVE